MDIENKAKRVAESKSVMTEMVMPNDANPMGNLMGGNLLRWMDIISSICAGKHCENQVVTVSVDNVAFKKPIHVGDIVTIEAMVTRSFHTSVEVYVEVYAADIKGKKLQEVQSCLLYICCPKYTRGKTRSRARCSTTDR